MTVVVYLSERKWDGSGFLVRKMNLHDFSIGLLLSAEGITLVLLLVF